MPWWMFPVIFTFIAVAVLLLALCRMSGDSDDRMDALLKRLREENDEDAG